MRNSPNVSMDFVPLRNQTGVNFENLCHEERVMKNTRKQLEDLKAKYVVATSRARSPLVKQKRSTNVSPQMYMTAEQMIQHRREYETPAAECDILPEILNAVQTDTEGVFSIGTTNSFKMDAAQRNRLILSRLGKNNLPETRHIKHRTAQLYDKVSHENPLSRESCRAPATAGTLSRQSNTSRATKVHAGQQEKQALESSKHASTY